MSAEEQRAREQFAKFDLDGDGLVSRDDFFAAMRRLDGARQKDDAVLQAMFDAADADGDGVVHLSDFVRMQKQRQRRRHTRLWRHR